MYKIKKSKRVQEGPQGDITHMLYLNGKKIGWMDSHSPDDKIQIISKIEIDPKYQRKEHGFQLMKIFEEELRKKGFKRIRVPESNEWMKRMLDKVGGYNIVKYESG